MSDQSSGEPETAASSGPQSAALSSSARDGLTEDEIRLIDLWTMVWAGKWQIIAITFLFAAASVTYALTATEWFRSEVLLAPAEDSNVSPLQNQFGGLAVLAGMNLGGGDTVEAVATLNSREFARDFIEEQNLLPVLLADEWDAENERWLADSPEDQPDIRDGIRYFHENVLRVDEDRGTGLVTLAVEWTDPVVAAEWATLLVQRLNEKLREKALAEAQANVVYLRDEMAKTNVLALQQAGGRLLESELQKLMLARGTEEFAFRVLDPAQPPDRRSRPKRALVAVLGTFAGGVISLIWVFVGHALRP